MSDPLVLPSLPNVARLVAIMARLRAPGGCPWDREQTAKSLRRYLIEEAYELVEAIDRDDREELCEELGDLLLQIVFHAQIAAERGLFDLDRVAAAVSDKLVRRHPHVFGDTRVGSTQEVLRNWARIKADERRERAKDDPRVQPGVLAGVPRTLPALLRAERLGEKASRVGLDWREPGEVVTKVCEELAELEEAVARGDRDAQERELGDLLFAIASLGRLLGLSTELALGAALDRFASRVARMEEQASGQNLASLSPEELDALWEEAKRAGD